MWKIGTIMFEREAVRATRCIGGGWAVRATTVAGQEIILRFFGSEEQAKKDVGLWRFPFRNSMVIGVHRAELTADDAYYGMEDRT